MCGVALTVSVAFGAAVAATAFGFGVAALLAGPALLAAGIVAALTATVMKWLLVGKFREIDHPLWSSFVWRNELADTFVEALAVPWLIGSIGGTPLLTAWLRTMGVKIGRGRLARDVLAARGRPRRTRRRRDDQPRLRRADAPVPRPDHEHVPGDPR